MRRMTDMRQRQQLVTFLGQILAHMQLLRIIHIAHDTYDRHDIGDGAFSFMDVGTDSSSDEASWSDPPKSNTIFLTTTGARLRDVLSKEALQVDIAS